MLGRIFSLYKGGSTQKEENFNLSDEEDFETALNSLCDLKDVDTKLLETDTEAKILLQAYDDMNEERKMEL